MATTNHVDWFSITYPSDIDMQKLLIDFYYDEELKSIASPIPVYGNAFQGQTTGVKILKSHIDRLGTHVIWSGKPLANTRKAIPNIDKRIWENVKANNGKIGRIDVCVNVYHEPLFTPEAVQNFHLMGESVTQLEREKAIVEEGGVQTYYIGKPNSKKQRFRVYDKKVESNALIDHYVRIELEKRHNAHNFAKNLFEKGYSIPSLIRGTVDFPNWYLWKRILSDGPQQVFRGEENDSKDEKSKLKWILNSAVPAIAKELVREANEHGTGINDSMLLQLISQRLEHEVKKEIVRHVRENGIVDNEQ